MPSRRSSGPRRQPGGRSRLEVVRVDSTTEVELDAALQFMRVVWSLVHTLQKTSKRMRRDLGVTAPQRLVIRVLGLSPRISAGALAKILHVHPSTLTGVLKRLEDQGALRRTVDPADARRHFLSLTARGRRVNAAQTGTVEAAVRRVLAGRPAVDREIVREVLSSVIHQLETAAAGSRKAAHRRRHRLA